MNQVAILAVFFVTKRMHRYFPYSERSACGIRLRIRHSISALRGLIALFSSVMDELKALNFRDLLTVRCAVLCSEPCSCI